MEILDIIKKRRTIRKFKQTPIEKEKLVKIIEAARLAPSGANLQPIKYIVVNKKELCDKIFPLTRWAAYLSPLGTPKENERPTAYIIVLVDTSIRKDGDNDASLATENMILTALCDEIGSCILGSIDREQIKELFKIEAHYSIHTLIALGYPDQEGFYEEEDGSIKYYLDLDGNIHVPKRKIENIAKFIE